MVRRIIVLRLTLALIYAVIVFGIAYTLIDGEFCKPPGTAGFVLHLLKLTAAITLLDSILSAMCAFVAFRMNSVAGTFNFPLGGAISAVVIGLIVFYIPQWIYAGYGVFRVEGTWADISCLFEEEVGFFFMFFGPFILGAVTLGRELLAEYMEDRWRRIEQKGS